MLAKKTSKYQLTLPKSVIANYPDVDYFDVRDEDGCILLIDAELLRLLANLLRPA